MIELEHLTKTFDDVVAVNDLTLDIGDGEFFGLLGPNGAGKTTTLLMLTTLAAPDVGYRASERVRPRARGGAGAPVDRHRLPGPEFRRHADRLREPEAPRHAVRHGAGASGEAHRGSARPRGPRRPARRHREALLGRHAAAARARAGPDASPESALPRRADAGTGPAIPRAHLGVRRAAGARGADHRGPDDALYGRGGSAVRPAGDHRSRPRGGPRFTGTTQARARRRRGDARRARAEPRGGRGRLGASTRSSSAGASCSSRCAMPGTGSRRSCGPSATVESVEVRPASLDDVFMHYTGREMRESSGEGGWAERSMRYSSAAR